MKMKTQFARCRKGLEFTVVEISHDILYHQYIVCLCYPYVESNSNPVMQIHGPCEKYSNIPRM